MSVSGWVTENICNTAVTSSANAFQVHWRVEVTAGASPSRWQYYNQTAVTEGTAPTTLNTSWHTFPITGIQQIRVNVSTCTNTPHELLYDDGLTRVQVLRTGFQEPVYDLQYGYLHDDVWEKLQGWGKFKDFAPLGEWIEVNKNQVQMWLKKMAKDPSYLRQQVLANIRHDIIYELETDIQTHWEPLYPAVQDIKAGRAVTHVNELLESLGKLTDDETRLIVDEWKTAIGTMRRERKDMIKAQETSLRLLKKWLTVEEWKQIRDNGEMAIPSKRDANTIYIVKKDVKQMVEVFKDKKYQHKLCLHLKDHQLPVGDQLLAKIILLKTDEERFLMTANIHP